MKRETEPLRALNENLKRKLEEVAIKLKNSDEAATAAEVQKAELIEKF